MPPRIQPCPPDILATAGNRERRARQPGKCDVASHGLRTMRLPFQRRWWGAQSRVSCPKLCEDRGAALALSAAMLCATCPREFTALCLELRFPSLSFWLLRLLAANRSMPEKRSSAAASRGPHLPPRRSYAVPVRAVQSIAGNTPKKSRRHLRPFAPLGPSTSCSAAFPSAALPRHSLRFFSTPIAPIHLSSQGWAVSGESMKTPSTRGGG